MSDTAGAADNADTGQQDAANAGTDTGDDKGQQAKNGTDTGTQTNGADTGTDTGKAADDAGGKAPEWRAGIEDEKLRDFAGRFTTPVDAVKVAFDLRQKLGKAIMRPGKDATDEERAAFHKALGVPEKPDGYKYKRPEDLGVELTDRDGERETAFLELAHAQGFTPGQAAATLDFLYHDMDEENTGMVKALTAGREKAEAELKKEWGEEYKANAEYAHRAATAYGGDEFLQFATDTEVDGVQLSNHPAVVKTFAAIGRRMGEHGIPLPMGDGERQTAEEQVKDIRAKKDAAMARGDQKEAQRLDQAERALYAKLDGNQPIVGAAGRTV